MDLFCGKTWYLHVQAGTSAMNSPSLQNFDLQVSYLKM